VDEAFLEFSSDGGRQRIAVDSDRFTLGRAVSNDLGLPEEATVSHQHAVIKRQADGWLINDLHSTNGTRVNGQMIGGPEALRSGDSIQLGQMQITFRVVGKDPGSAGRPPSGYLAKTEEWGAVDQSPPSRMMRPELDQVAQELSHGPAAGSRVADPPFAPGYEQVPASRPSAAPQRPAADRARRSGRGPAAVEGQIRAIQRDRGQSGVTWRFRIERYDSDGNRLPPIAAILVGDDIEGSLNEGDEARVIGTWKDGTLHVDHIDNLTTRAGVKVPFWKKRKRMTIIAAVIFAIGVIAVILFGILTTKYSDQQYQNYHQKWCQSVIKNVGQTPPDC
jgi:hypothetical protein